VESGRSSAQLLRAMYVCVVATIAAGALAVAPASANAASPVLEFVSPGNAFPIPFEAEGGEVSARLAEFDPIVECEGSEGEGAITGPRSTLSNYFFFGCVANGGAENGNACTSEDAEEPEEIVTGTIEADLVYLDQSKHEVAMLLNPQGGVYMEFDCGGETVKASGPFLSPVDPVNKLANSFTAALRRNGASQIPDEYESANGERHQAIPMGQKGSDPPDMTGVELEFTIQPSVSLEIKAVNATEVETKQRADEDAAKKRQDDESAAKKRAEEEAAIAKKHQAEAGATARKQHLTKALKQCRKIKPGQRRARCVKRAGKRYGARRKAGS
jgi:hypothetical protein